MPRFEILGDGQIDVSQLGEDGWSSLVKLEVQMLRELVMDYSRRTALQCHRAKLAVEARNSLSMRFKALLQGTALGRALWAAMKAAADAAISPSSLLAEVKERAETIKKSGIEALLAGSVKSGALLLDTVARHPSLVPSLLKTGEALVQLPGSIDASCQVEHDLLQSVIQIVTDLVNVHAANALQAYADMLEDFWASPLKDPRWFKSVDVLLQVFIACKAAS